MYRTNLCHWTKHSDFIALDALMIEISYALIYLIMRPHLSDNNGMYLSEGLLLLFSDLLAAFFTEPYKNILRRPRHSELLNVCRHILIVYMLDIICLYFVKSAQPYSRLLIGLSAALSVLLCTLMRLARKAAILKRAAGEKADRSIIVITTSARMQKAVENLQKKTFHPYKIPAVFLIDVYEPDEKEHEGIQVYGRSKDIIDYICHSWCDAVYVDTVGTYVLSNEVTSSLLGMGITIHTTLNASAGDYLLENVGEEKVLTESLRMVDARMLFFKRCLDIVGGLIGCLITVILYIFIAPQIKHASPGPAFFAQVRIGKNGRKFRMYKFRSMYPDAEARKRELMTQNKSDDGFIFKMDDDPRIIGSEKKDKYGHPNGIGNFIRRTSIDEFPQFWNVLKGDMSLVGTRPPTLDEWQKYTKKQRLRMSIKPGITGIWQVSGRSEVTDFDEILQMDAEYIRKMSVWEDMKILVKTVQVVARGRGAE